MLNRMKKEQGFTLIELLIVVAIIGILAAVAIPQFAAYRQRGFNSSALSDMRNLKTGEEALFGELTGYGVTDGGAAGVLLNAATPAAGLVWQGPIPPAIGGAAPVAGGRIAGVNAQGQNGAVPIGVSNGVNMIATCGLNGTQYDSYIIAARHEQADTAYAAGSVNTTSTYRASNPAWIGVPNVLSALTPAAVANADALNGFAAGGSPTGAWTIM